MNYSQWRKILFLAVPFSCNDAAAGVNYPLRFSLRATCRHRGEIEIIATNENGAHRPEKFNNRVNWDSANSVNVAALLPLCRPVGTRCLVMWIASYRRWRAALIEIDGPALINVGVKSSIKKSSLRRLPRERSPNACKKKSKRVAARSSSISRFGNLPPLIRHDNQSIGPGYRAVVAIVKLSDPRSMSFIKKIFIDLEVIRL